MKAHSSVGTRFFVLQNCFALVVMYIGAKFKASCHNEVECHNCIHTACNTIYVVRGPAVQIIWRKGQAQSVQPASSSSILPTEHLGDALECNMKRHSPVCPWSSTKHSCRSTPYCLTCETDLLSFDQMYQSTLTQSHLPRLSVSTSNMLYKIT